MCYIIVFILLLLFYVSPRPWHLNVAKIGHNIYDVWWQNMIPWKIRTFFTQPKWFWLFDVYVLKKIFLICFSFRFNTIILLFVCYYTPIKNITPFRVLLSCTCNNNNNNMLSWYHHGAVRRAATADGGILLYNIIYYIILYHIAG